MASTSPAPASRTARTLWALLGGLVLLGGAGFALCVWLLAGTTHKLGNAVPAPGVSERRRLQLDITREEGALQLVSHGGLLIREGELVELYVPLDVTNTSAQTLTLLPQLIPTVTTREGRVVHADRGQALDPQSGLALARHQSLSWTLTYLLRPTELPVRLATPEGPLSIDFTGMHRLAAKPPAATP